MKATIDGSSTPSHAPSPKLSLPVWSSTAASTAPARHGCGERWKLVLLRVGGCGRLAAVVVPVRTCTGVRLAEVVLRGGRGCGGAGCRLEIRSRTAPATGKMRVAGVKAVYLPEPWMIG